MKKSKAPVTQSGYYGKGGTKPGKPTKPAPKPVKSGKTK